MDLLDDMSELGLDFEMETPPPSPIVPLVAPMGPVDGGGLVFDDGACDDGMADVAGVIDVVMGGGDEADADEVGVDGGEVDGPPRKGADFAIGVPGGVIRLYKTAGVMRAFCGCATHSKCILERSYKISERDTWRGRPLGSLLAWLQLQHHDAIHDQHSHVWFRPFPDQDMRIEARRSALHLHGIENFTAVEREPRPSDRDGEALVSK